MKKLYFLSFIEEFVMNPKYNDYIAGRIEVYDKTSDNVYAVEEIRWFTKKQKEFIKFRENWDFKDINQKSLDWLRVFMEENYCDKI